MQQDVRYRRVGGDQPYRDDPNDSARFESFAEAGLRSPGHTGTVKNSLGIGDDHNKVRGTASSIMSFKTLSSCLSSNSRGRVDEGLNGRYYRDDFNDYSWRCSAGTTDEDGIWLNQNDGAGTIMCLMVWILLGYSSLTITLLAQTGGIDVYQSFIYTIMVTMALTCHIKTTLTDPGSVPASAVPTEEQRKYEKLSMCSQCQTFKPPLSHHCRICNRCISRMDHHCPWMNNCVGAGNIKHFFLFLIYTWSCSVYCLLLLGWNYFFCASDDCEFNLVLTQLVRIMTLLCIAAFLFTSSMIMNVVYGIITGVGTIDRLKKKATNTINDSIEEPVRLVDIFGIGPWYTWPIPIDPIFEDIDYVMGFSTPQRLLREQILREKQDQQLQQRNGGVNMGKLPPV